MTELTFTAGAHATFDLRDSAGEVVVKDWDGATIKIETSTEAAPYVLRESDSFRVKLAQGGTISLPLGLPAEIMTPVAVRVRVMRAGGETDVRPAETGARPAGAPAGEAPRDFAEFADVMSDYGRRIFQDVAKAVRSGGAGGSEEVARKLEEVSDKIEETARRAAERIQREVERAVSAADKYEEHGRRAAHQAEERARRVAEKVARHTERHAERHAQHQVEREAHRAERAARQAERVAERAARRASRGGWWFADRMGEWASTGAAGTGRRTEEQRKATEQERLAIMQMLRDGKISAEQAAQLLDALGG